MALRRFEYPSVREIPKRASPKGFTLGIEQHRPSQGGEYVPLSTIRTGRNRPDTRHGLRRSVCPCERNTRIADRFRLDGKDLGKIESSTCSASWVEVAAPESSGCWVEVQVRIHTGDFESVLSECAQAVLVRTVPIRIPWLRFTPSFYQPLPRVTTVTSDSVKRDVDK